MRCKRLVSLYLLLITLLAALPAPVSAAHGNGSAAVLTVQATILPWLKIDQVRHINNFQVTPEDMRRGFTDLTSAVTLNYRTNIQDAITLQLSALGPEQILVRQSGSTTDTVVIPHHGAGGAPATISLDLRVILPPETVAGDYPLRLSIIPTIL